MKEEKKDKELISVVVPIYNVERYLQRCVDSLLKQTYSPCEIILVDDGSPDHCGKIADEYAENNTGIRVFHKKNGGLGAARNFGVQKAEGNRIVFVDSDDYVRETYVSDLMQLMEKYEADVAITAIRRSKEGDILPVQNRFTDFCVSAEEAIAEVYTGDKIGWSAYGKIFKKELLVKEPFPDGYYEDSACMYKILDLCEKVAVGDYAANYHYIVREGSILQSRLSLEHLKIFDICDEFRRFAETRKHIPKTVPVMFYRNAVVQLLRCQKMPWPEYCRIFSLYTKYFRNNLASVMKNAKVTWTYRLYYIALCTHPIFFKMLMKLVDIVK